MVYDEKYSLDVPVYRILDYLIETEDISIVFGFMKMYSNDELRSIFKYSQKFTDIFQIDVIRKMKRDDIRYLMSLFEIVDTIYPDVVMCMLRQIFRSDLPVNIKSMFQPDFNFRKGMTGDPYLGRSGTEGMRFDARVYQAYHNGCIGEVTKGMTSADVQYMVGNLMDHSAFRYRMLSHDFYEYMTADVLLFFIDSLILKLNTCSYWRFGYKTGALVRYYILHLRHMLLSDIPVDAKSYIVSKSRSLIQDMKIYDEQLVPDDYKTVECFEELIMKIDLVGCCNVDVQEILMYHMVNNPELFNNIVKEAPEFLEEHFPVGKITLT